jgi:hemolysin activation/secretion protein
MPLMNSPQRRSAPVAPAGCRLAAALGLLLSPALAAAQQAEEATPAPAKVTINEYVVRGNTVLTARQIETAVTPFLGPDKTMDDVESARDALSELYQQAGYQSVFVELPEQQVTGGVVLLKVNQTPIGQLRVVGAKHDSPERIREQVPSLAEGQVPDFNAAQTELSALNRSGRRQVMPIVKEGATAGTMDVDLQVDDRSPWRASAALNNDHSADTEDLRLSASIGHDNLWQLGHSATLSLYTAPEDTDQAKVISASYVAPFQGTPWALEFNGYKSDSQVLDVGGQGGAGGGTSVLGDGHSLGLKLTYLLESSAAWWRQVSLGVDFKDTKEDTRLGEESMTTPLKYAPITLGITGVRQGEADVLNFNAQLVVGTRRLLGYGSDTAEFDQKRFRADPSFVVLKGEVANTHTFASDWQWYARGSVQMTDAPLVSAEQYAAGGMYTVRGYLSAEAIGDYGALANLEWRTPAWRVGSWMDARLYAFTDAAYLRLRSPLPEQEDKYNLASFGIGASLRFGDHLQLRLDYGYPYSDGPTTSKDDPRFNFNLSTSY